MRNETSSLGCHPETERGVRPFRETCESGGGRREAECWKSIFWMLVLRFWYGVFIVEQETKSTYDGSYYGATPTDAGIGVFLRPPIGLQVQGYRTLT